MLICIQNGRVIDPANRRDEVADVWMRDGRVVDATQGAVADQVYDATGKFVMAGAIDIHSHIAGANENIARLMRPEMHHPGHESGLAPFPFSTAVSSTFATGCRYAEMGFTLVVEPAVAPHHALQAHLELSDIPIIDKATLAVLGNDDFLLNLMYCSDSVDAITDVEG